MHFHSWLDQDCIQLNVSAHKSLCSLIEIKTIVFNRITSLQEVVAVGRGYQTMPIYGSMSSAVAANGGAVVTKDRELFSLSIYPVGEKEEGHSFQTCFE